MGLSLVFADAVRSGDSVNEDGNEFTVERVDVVEGELVVIAGFDVDGRRISRTFKTTDIVWCLSG